MPVVKVTREDWLRCALEALTVHGVAGVAVEPLARGLGVTRGSFYWHFPDRAALLTAALEEWERIGTSAVIDEVDGIEPPSQRLRVLLTRALTDDPLAGLESAVVAHAHDPLVGPVLERVTRRRLDYLAAVLSEIGLTPVVARRHALATYAAYLGWLELRRAAPGAAPETTLDQDDKGGALAHLVELIVPTVDAVTAGPTRA
jgi:AcrR family transcriptional regulator